MLASKIPENRSAEDVWTSPVRSWKVPGAFISLRGSSGEVVGGFWGGSGEGLRRPGGGHFAVAGFQVP